MTYKYTKEQLGEPENEGQPDRLFDWQTKTNGAVKAFGGLKAVADGIRSDLVNGLSVDEVCETRAVEFGSNKTEQGKGLTYWELIMEGLKDFTLILLLGAAAVSIVFGMITEPETGWIEGLAIMIAVVLVLNVAAINDLQKDKQFRDLNAINDKKTLKVIRGGVKQTILSDDLLVGDVCVLEAGDQICADGIFISGNNTKTGESAMTGEPDQVTKNEEKPYLISGTELMEGNCKMLVVAVGPNSVMGRISALLVGEKTTTPLQSKLEKLATQISKLGFFVAVAVILVMTAMYMIEFFDEDRDWETEDFAALVEFFIIGVTILVVAIPEGLPLAVTIALAFSVKKMMKDMNLVRHLDACETMGGASTICSDKTGTLTQNRMTVMQAWFSEHGGKNVNLLSPLRAVEESDIKKEYSEFLKKSEAQTDITKAILVGNSCINSEAFLLPNEGGAPQKGVGSVTEVALLMMCSKMGFNWEDERNKFQVLHKHPFHSDRKRSSVVVRLSDGRARLFVKGASEMILRLCTQEQAGDKAIDMDGSFCFDSEGRVHGDGRKAELAKAVITAMADKALRTIAIAYRDFDHDEDWSKTIEYPSSAEKGAGDCPAIEDGLTLVGVVGIQDPVRPEVPDSVKQCQSAGIMVRMVTGDNINTAKAIALQCNIFHKEEHVDPYGVRYPQGVAMEGPEFRKLVGGLALPPHFYHKCECKDCSRLGTNDPHYVSGYRTQSYPAHFGYPSIVGHTCDECNAWTEDEINSRGGIEKCCTEECKQRGCFIQLRKKQKSDPAASEKDYMVIRNQAKFDSLVRSLQVMARSAPSDKHLLVTGLRERGQVVAVTGDGTNDGPALKKADVGFAMGVTGTEVAKNASDIILMDDNFTSIVKAVQWGRNVYDSIRKFLQFQLTVNVVALFLQFTVAITVKDSPLSAVQMLWVNLIMDTFASLALATEPPTPQLLNRKPYGRDESLISQTMSRNILGQAIYQATILLGLVFFGDRIFEVPTGVGLGHGAPPTIHFTLVFHVFVMMQVFNEINARKIANEANVFKNIFKSRMFVVIVVGTIIVQMILVEIAAFSPGFGAALSVKALNLEQNVVCILIGAVSLIIGQAIRFVPANMFPVLGGKEITEEEEKSKSQMLMRRRNTSKSLVGLPSSRNLSIRSAH